MKRTRRVEVTRYTLRSTVVGDASLETDPVAERAALEVLLGIPGALDAPAETNSRTEQGGNAIEGSSVTHRRRPLKFLKRLIKG